MRILVSTTILFFLWMILTQSFHPQELFTGIIVSAIIALISPSVAGERAKNWFNPKRYFYLIIYLFYFIWEMIKSNIDVAKRVLNPKLPINPGIVKVKTKLKSRSGKLALANSITLTPGTLTVDIVDQYLYIHWIDVETTDIGEASERIVAGFEKYLEVIFE
ncbi:MAG: Na+/H+ antiporter subunit E [Acidobacteriota bacterium]